VPVSGTYAATIYAVKDDDKLEYFIGTIQIKNAKEVADEQFSAKPEIGHQFRPDEKTANPFISNLFTILTLSPWLFLIGTVSLVHLVEYVGPQCPQYD
jgi:hypothetical protein